MRIMTPLRRVAMRMIYAKRLNSRWANVLASLDVWPLNEAGIDANGDLTLPGLPVSIKEATPAALILIRGHRISGDLGRRGKAQFAIHQDHIEIEVCGVKGIIRNDADLGVFHEIFVERLYAFEFPGPFYAMDIGANIGLASLFFASEYDADVVAYELVESTTQLAIENLRLNPNLAAKISMHSGGLSDYHGEFEIETDPSTRTSNSLIRPNLTATRTKEMVRVLDVGPILQAALSQAAGRTFVLKIDAEGAEYEILRKIDELNLLAYVDVIFLEWHERDGKDPEYFREMFRKAGFVWTERQHPEAPVGLINAFRANKLRST